MRLNYSNLSLKDRIQRWAYYIIQWIHYIPPEGDTRLLWLSFSLIVNA